MSRLGMNLSLSAPVSPLPPRRKIPRIDVACDQCRRRRRRCDGAKPRCYGCEIRDLPCSFNTSRSAQGTPPSISQSHSSSAKPHSIPTEGVASIETQSPETSTSEPISGQQIQTDQTHSPFPGSGNIVASAPIPRSRDLPPSNSTSDKIEILLPPRETADKLVDIYFKYVHTIFPFLHEPSFRKEYEKLWSEQSGSNDVSLMYCILYLVFALGCQFSTLFEDPIQGGDVYLNRAKSLLGFWVFDTGTVRVVQALLLLGVYLQSTNRPNRCWNVVGMGIRVAQGIQLHLDSEVTDLVEREIRRRAWWGCLLMDRLLAMLFGRPLMIHGEDAFLLPAPVVQDDENITSDSIISKPGPSKMGFFIATSELYKIMGDILRELYSPEDDFRAMKESVWLLKVGLIMRFDKELKEFVNKLPSYLQWGSQDDVSDDIIRQRNVLRARTLNVRNLLYRPSLIFLGQAKQATKSALDLSTTLSCANLCVDSAKNTIELFHTTAFRLTGPFWFNVFFIYTAATALLGICLCHDKGEAPDISADWEKAIGYLKCISPKCGFAEQCAKVLEAMMTQMNPSYKLEVRSEVPSEQALAKNGGHHDMSFVFNNHTATSSWSSPDWAMQDIVWSNIPWDWGLVDEYVMGYE